MKKYPSFKADHGRKPICGIDYSPDNCMCQDDYEYLMGTGNYSDDIIHYVYIINGEYKILTSNKRNDAPMYSGTLIECESFINNKPIF